MARILSLFSRGSVSQDMLAGEGTAPRLPASENTTIAGFESLAETQQTIDYALASVYQGLSGVQDLVAQVAKLKTDLAATFEEHRKLALINSSLEQDRGHLGDKLREKNAQYETLSSDHAALRSQLEETRSGLEKAQAELEGLEHRHHLLGVSKKEVDAVLARTSAQLIAAQDEIEGLHMEVASLKDQAETDAARISELTASFNETFEKSSLLANRCEAYEASSQLRAEEIAHLREQVELLSHEKNAANQQCQQKEQEVANVRSELSRLFEKAQSDNKIKEAELNNLRIEFDGSRSSVKMLEQVNADLKTENEKLMAQARQLQELNKNLEVSVSRLEAKVGRLGNNLEATTAAKAQIDESRVVMSKRVEAATQALRASESDIKRLEGEVVRLTALNEEQGARARDTADSLNARIFELEKELNAQKQEAAFYAAQLETIKRPEPRGTLL
jgi:chromosome segregation ATPase